MLHSSEHRTFFLLMFGYEFAHLIDGADTAEIAFTLRGAPGKQSVAAKNQTIAAGMALHGRFDHQGELEPGSLPRHPDHFAVEFAIELVQLLFAVPACGQRDRPIRMKMI